MRRFAALPLVFLLIPIGPVSAQDQKVVPESALSWQPKEYPEAKLHPRISYLQPEREWERMDIWVPHKPKDEKGHWVASLCHF